MITDIVWTDDSKSSLESNLTAKQSSHAERHITLYISINKRRRLENEGLVNITGDTGRYQYSTTNEQDWRHMVVIENSTFTCITTEFCKTFPEGTANCRETCSVLNSVKDLIYYTRYSAVACKAGPSRYLCWLPHSIFSSVVRNLGVTTDQELT